MVQRDLRQFEDERAGEMRLLDRRLRAEEQARLAIVVGEGFGAQPHLRARSVGLYYFIRSCAIAPAGFIGGLLWRVSPDIPFYVAGVAGLVGTSIFAATVAKEQAG